MAYGFLSLEQRMKDNVKDCNLGLLFNKVQMTEYLKNLSSVLAIDILVTERHGEKLLAIGDFTGFVPNEVNEPGRKIQVLNHTVGHMHIRMDKIAETKVEGVNEFLDSVVGELSVEAEKAYRYREIAIYADELEAKLEKEQYQVKHGDKEDALTGVMNHNYFENRLRIVDRAEVVPVAVICGNINDWKYVNDTYGDDESDRLIQVIAGFMKKEAKPEYVIGRWDGDVLNVIIPLAEPDEAELYCKRVQKRCLEYADDKLAPSIAFGIVMKTNIEEKLTDLFSDAEYEMFNNKFELKNAIGYLERLHRVNT